MKQFAALALIMGALSSVVRAQVPPLEGETLEHAIILSMILSQDDDRSIVGVRLLAQLDPFDDAACDYVAERLLKDSAVPRAATRDAVVWYVIALRDSCSARYRNALALARQRYTDAEIVQHLDVAPARPADPAARQYAEDDVDLLLRESGLQRQLRAQAAEFRPAVYLPDGMALGPVLQQAGAPDALSAVIVNTLVLHYRNGGMLTFRRDRETRDWRLWRTDVEVFPVSESIRGPKFELAHELACLRGKRFRVFVKVHEAEIRQDPALLWVLATRLARNLTPVDRQEEDGLLVALKTILNSGNPDARAMLQQIAAAPGDVVPATARSYLEPPVR